MGFRQPIDSFVDTVARAAADAAQNDAARALTQIIPGSRIAIDALDFKTAVGMTLSAASVTGATVTGGSVTGASVTGSTVRAQGTGDASATSTGHAFQAGLTSGQNVAIDGNEVLARNNGALSPLFLTSPRASAESEDPATAPGVAFVTKTYVDGGGAAAAVLKSGFTAATGWTLSAVTLRRVGSGLAYLSVTVTKATAALTVPTSGDVTNTVVGNLPTGWEPIELAPLVSTTVGRIAHGWVAAVSTAVSVGAVAGTGDIAIGDQISLTGFYRLATP